MPWNEPGGKDPWGKRNKHQGPPDLEELLRKLNARLGGLFGGGSGNGGSRPSGGKGAALGAGIVAVVLLVVWLFSGIYIVDAGERGLVLRFGRYVHTTEPGPHWNWPYPIGSVETVAVDLVRDAQHEASMLTQDENIVTVDVAVQYRVKDATKYAFEVRVPDATLEQAMEAATREAVGANTLEYVLGEGRAEVATAISNRMQQMLDGYQSGLRVVTVNLQQAQPPEPVQPAFADVVMAREDRIRFVNQAQSYANAIVPQARGAAARVEQQAIAYRNRVVASAQGEADRFSQVLTQYREAPLIMRDRLYLGTMESVLSNSSKIMMDVRDSNNLIYLPLDKIIRQGESASGRRRLPDFELPAAGSSFDSTNDVRQPRSLMGGREAR
ncbi:MAG: FtsH protease activity modulator HflK [Gammaproteobacteria bacterium]